jgi:hypothetical protein
MHRLSLFVALLFVPTTATLAQTPEADVTAAEKRTLDAYNRGDTITFRAMFMPTVRGFWIDNSVLTDGDDISAPSPAGGEPKPNVSLRGLSVRVYGNTAVIAGYFVGTLYDGRVPKIGTWRFTETRIKDGNAWKVVQFHFSPLGP